MAVKEIAPGFKLVKYKHKAFQWKGKSYNLQNLSALQAQELFSSGWPYIAKVAKKKEEASE